MADIVVEVVVSTNPFLRISLVRSVRTSEIRSFSTYYFRFFETIFFDSCRLTIDYEIPEHDTFHASIRGS